MPKALTYDEIVEAARKLGIEPCAIMAIIKNETNSWLGKTGFLPDGRPTILFESHIFWSQLKKKGIDPNKYAVSHVSVLTPSWNAEARKKYKGGAAEHDRLALAASINRDAALMSASWGTFQIMGFNYKVCGFKTLQEFINCMYRDGRCHLQAFIGFLQANGIVQDLKAQNWANVARKYNGAGYAKNGYHTKLKTNFDACRVQFK